MTIQQEKHYKEINPFETVEKLKDICSKNNIEIEESWLRKSSIGTYSVRVTLKGTDIGANGKGVTQEFALASAYAEFFERFQNNFLEKCDVPYKDNFDFHYFIDEKLMSSLEIARLDNSFMKMYFNIRCLENSTDLEKAKAFRDVQKIDEYVYGRIDEYVTVPFYSIKNSKVEYIPYNTYLSFYGSNGMCAGNSPEEALVQGLSEIIERYVQKKIFNEKPNLPDIPEEYIKQFPDVYQIYKRLRLIDGYTFLLKDCTFGGKYPVAGLIIIKNDTGEFGIKLGCNPDYGVAIERTFTEITQGGDITEYFTCKINFYNLGVDDPINILNSYRSGRGKYPYQIIKSPKEIKFKMIKDVSSMSNKEILKDMISFFKRDGYDILIHDVSYLGFPSFHIIIPTLSELDNCDDTKFRLKNTSNFIIKLLNNPYLIDKNNVKYILGVLNFYSNSNYSLNKFYGTFANFELPSEEVNGSLLYMICMCLLMDKSYKKCADIFSQIVKAARKFNSKNLIFYECLNYYIQAMSVMDNHDQVIDYLKILFNDEVVFKIDYIFKDSSKIIIKQYPIHNYMDKEKCKLDNCCYFNSYFNYQNKFKDIQKKYMVNQDNIGVYLKNIEGR